MTAPKDINRLIERFQENRDIYCSSQYNEAQARIEFIDPLFKALGWDMTNEKGYAEAYKEVIHEDAIKVGGATKAPDYAFRIGGVRKFFVEAKRPGLNIKEDGDAAYQLRRYAWSAKLPLSIVTDFEEFAVYDCRIKPAKTDKASAGRVLYLTVDEYDQHWDEIAQIFSQDAILTGSFDKYVESSKKKRGTAEVDTAFLKEIEAWRDVLARNIALRNAELSTRELNFAVQRTIDRIIFLRICEDRGIEDYGQLMALRNGTNIYQRLCQIFRRADERYNSGLFHFSTEKDRLDPPDNLTLNLTIDDNLIKGIIKGLYYPESPFEFSVLPADILGHIYEQFLGKVIRLTPGHHAKVEDKPEVKKAGGVYYTPTYIVDYIVKNTVGKLLEQNTPTKVSSLRILDPACGSGSFLLGAYQTLLDWHQEWYTKHDPEKHAKGRSPKVYLGPGGEWRLTTPEKKRILLNNIYGVDIDTQAVEVTKLSLLLKVLEGENAETLGKNLRLFHERALPDLGDNIKCGNSLIGPDFYEGKQISLLDEEERYRINAFDWNAEFPHIFSSPSGRGQGEGSGFDAVIGNPPYIRIQRIQQAEADYYFTTYNVATGKTDLSVVFLDRALQLLRKDGLAAFICSSQWLQTNYGRQMRQKLSQGLLYELVDFGSLQVFRGASTYPAVFVLGSNPRSQLVLKKLTDSSQLTLKALEAAPSSMIQFERLSDRPWSFDGIDVEAMLEERGITWCPLACFGKARVGTKCGLNDAFVVSLNDVNHENLERDLLLSYAYRGAEVQRYAVVNPEAFLIYPYREGDGGKPVLIEEAELQSQYPRTYAHLYQYKEGLRKRRDSRKYYAMGSDWYRLVRPGSFSYVRPIKLVLRGIAVGSCVGILPENTAFDGARCPAIVFDSYGGHDIRYFLGILNSTLASYQLRRVCPRKLSGYIELSSTRLSAFPVRVIEFAEPEDRKQHETMINLVEAMLGHQRALPAAKTSHDKKLIQRQIDTADKQIDRLVYELYGLTEAEIKIIEKGESGR